MPQKSFEEILKEKTSGFSPMPAADGWDKIAAGLEPEKKRRILPFYFFAAASIVIAGILTICFYSPTAKEIKLSSKSALKHQSADSKPFSDHRSSANEQVNATTVNTLKGKKSNTTNDPSTALLHTKQPSNVVTRENDQTIIGTSTILNSEDNLFSEFLLPIQPVNVIFEPQYVQVYPVIEGPEINLFKVKLPKKPGVEKFRFFAGVNAAALMNSTIISIKDEFKGQEPYQTEYDNRKKEDMGKMSSLYGFELGMANNRHRLSLGLNSFNVAYQIRVTNANKDISSGLITRAGSFNYYTSDSFVAESSENGGGYVTNSFKYIGIPLNYGYNFFGHNGVSFSLNAGLQYNHMIKNSGLVYRESSGIYVKQNVAGENTLTNNHFSASAGLSLNFKVGNRFEIYVNPAIKRSLKAIEQGTVSTNYSQMSLMVGLRFFPVYR